MKLLLLFFKMAGVFYKGYPDNPKFTPHIYNKNQYSHRTIKTVLYILVALYTFKKSKI